LREIAHLQAKGGKGRVIAAEANQHEVPRRYAKSIAGASF
jgi:hypothetical protein